MVYQENYAKKDSEYTDNYSEKNTQYIRNYPPHVAELQDSQNAD